MIILMGILMAISIIVISFLAHMYEEYFIIGYFVGLIVLIRYITLFFYRLEIYNNTILERIFFYKIREINRSSLKVEYIKQEVGARNKRTETLIYLTDGTSKIDISNYLNFKMVKQYNELLDINIDSLILGSLYKIRIINLIVSIIVLALFLYTLYPLVIKWVS